MNPQQELRLLRKLSQDALILLYLNEKSCFNQMCKIVEAFQQKEK